MMIITCAEQTALEFNHLHSFPSERTTETVTDGLMEDGWVLLRGDCMREKVGSDFGGCVGLDKKKTRYLFVEPLTTVHFIVVMTTTTTKK